MKYLFFYFSFLLIGSNLVSAQTAPAHIVVVILENKSYSQVAGNPLTPYINSLLADPHTAILTQSYGLMHPSQPNYLQLFSGSQQGVINNNLPVGLPFSTPNLGAALINKGFSFTGYSEDLPSIGYTGEISGAYARKHNPWVNWQSSPVNGIPLTLNKSFTDFPASFSSLPTVSLVVPNQNNDMHNGTLAISLPICDSWLQQNLNNYIQWCKSNNSVFLLTFDEDDGFYNNQILTFVTGEHVNGGTYNQPVTHYNILRTIEELYQLPYSGNSVDSSAIRNIWNEVAVCNGNSISLQSNLTGTTYQWQLNQGNGFADIADNSYYVGTKTSTLHLNNVPSTWYGFQYRCVVNNVNGNLQTLKFIDYWTGANSNIWEDPLNWSCGLAPDQNTDVVIHTNHNVVLNSTVSVRSFTISAGANFIQNSPYQLNIIH